MKVKGDDAGGTKFVCGGRIFCTGRAMGVAKNMSMLRCDSFQYLHHDASALQFSAYNRSISKGCALKPCNSFRNKSTWRISSLHFDLSRCLHPRPL